MQTLPRNWHSFAKKHGFMTLVGGKLVSRGTVTPPPDAEIEDDDGRRYHAWRIKPGESLPAGTYVFLHFGDRFVTIPSYKQVHKMHEWIIQEAQKTARTMMDSHAQSLLTMSDRERRKPPQATLDAAHDYLFKSAFKLKPVAPPRRNGSRLRDDFDLGEALEQADRAVHAPRRNGAHQVTIDAKSDRPLSTRDYPGLFQDTDQDGIPDPDDAHPRGGNAGGRVEEVALTSEVAALIDLRNAIVEDKQALEKHLIHAFPGRKVYGRVKTPYSIINKLRRKRLFHPQHGITDLVGLTVIAQDKADADRLRAFIQQGGAGQVVEEADFYASPQAGYRAYHFILNVPSGVSPTGSLATELQLKTQRQAKLAAAAHTPYKEGRHNAALMDELGALVDRADRGDLAAARAVDPLLADEAALTRRLTR